MFKVFAVAGQPIIHSKSPYIFNAAFKYFSLNAKYIRISASDTSEIIHLIKELNIQGLNITAPYKQKIIPYLDSIDDNAKKIGAINTIIVNKGKLYGYNTDFYGVHNALLSKGVEIEGKKAIVLGAGGAAAAAAFSLIESRANTFIANRTLSKGQALADRLGCKHIPLVKVHEDLVETDILVSCLSTKQRVIPHSALHKNLVILDAIYPSSTLIEDANKQKCTTINGTQWLLFQALPAFKLFTGLEAPVNIMKSSLTPIEKKRHIALIGFMGTGKTSVAHNLSQISQKPLLDIDNEIEKNTHTSIKDIFANQGESKFRNMEQNIIANIGQIPPSIIACGGGAALDKFNVSILKKHCIIIWLITTEETIKQRISQDLSRPLFNVEKMQTMLNNRYSHYLSAADMVMTTENKKPDEIARLIFNETN